MGPDSRDLRNSLTNRLDEQQRRREPSRTATPIRGIRAIRWPVPRFAGNSRGQAGIATS